MKALGLLITSGVNLALVGNFFRQISFKILKHPPFRHQQLCLLLGFLKLIFWGVLFTFETKKLLWENSANQVLSFGNFFKFMSQVNRIHGRAEG